MQKRTQLAFALLLSFPLFAEDWRPVRGSILGGISDLALVSHSEQESFFLVIHDNKQPKEPRVGLIRVANPAPVQYQPVEWPDSAKAIDLESISQIPGTDHEYLALVSRGTLYHLRLSPDHLHLTTIRTAKLPGANDLNNFEGLSVQSVDNAFLIAWADRGSEKEPAELHFGTFDVATLQVANMGKALVKVPWPTKFARHISEMKIDETGATFIAAASDPGDDGPFASAIYLAGVFRREQGRFVFRQHPRMLRLRTIADHKIEAMELVPGNGGIIYGTDDENFGGWIATSW